MLTTSSYISHLQYNCRQKLAKFKTYKGSNQHLKRKKHLNRGKIKV